MQVNFQANNGIYRSVNQKHPLPKGERDYQLLLVIKVIRENLCYYTRTTSAKKEDLSLTQRLHNAFQF